MLSIYLNVARSFNDSADILKWACQAPWIVDTMSKKMQCKSNFSRSAFISDVTIMTTGSGHQLVRALNKIQQWKIQTKPKFHIFGKPENSEPLSSADRFWKTKNTSSYLSCDILQTSPSFTSSASRYLNLRAPIPFHLLKQETNKQRKWKKNCLKIVV